MLRHKPDIDEIGEPRVEHHAHQQALHTIKKQSEDDKGNAHSPLDKCPHEHGLALADGRHRLVVYRLQAIGQARDAEHLEIGHAGGPAVGVEQDKQRFGAEQQDEHQRESDVGQGKCYLLNHVAQGRLVILHLSIERVSDLSHHLRDAGRGEALGGVGLGVVAHGGGVVEAADEQSLYLLAELVQQVGKEHIEAKAEQLAERLPREDPLGAPLDVEPEHEGRNGRRQHVLRHQSPHTKAFIGHDNGDREGRQGCRDGYDGQNLEVELFLQLIALNDIEGIDEQDKPLHPQHIAQQRDAIEPRHPRSRQVEYGIQNHRQPHVPEEDGGIVGLRGSLFLDKGGAEAAVDERFGQKHEYHQHAYAAIVVGGEQTGKDNTRNELDDHCGVFLQCRPDNP